MSEKAEAKVPPEEKAEPEVFKQVWTHHYVIHIELLNPIQKGEHRQSYLRFNIEGDSAEVRDGVLCVPKIGHSRMYVPIANVVCWFIKYVYVVPFDDTDDWEYVPIEEGMYAENNVGTYRREDKEGNTQMLGCLYQTGEINRWPLTYEETEK